MNKQNNKQYARALSRMSRTDRLMSRKLTSASKKAKKKYDKESLAEIKEWR